MERKIGPGGWTSQYLLLSLLILGFCTKEFWEKDARKLKQNFMTCLAKRWLWTVWTTRLHLSRGGKGSRSSGLRGRWWELMDNWPVVWRSAWPQPRRGERRTGLWPHICVRMIAECAKKEQPIYVLNAGTKVPTRRKSICVMQNRDDRVLNYIATTTIILNINRSTLLLPLLYFLFHE